MCSNYTNRRTVSERAGGTAGCNMSSLTVAVLPPSVRLVGLDKAGSLLHCPVALSLEEDGLPDSTQRKGHQTALTQWSSLCSYPPSPDILFYPLLMTKQKQNKGNHTPVPNVCLCWVLGEREEEEQMKWEGRVGSEGQPSSESSGLCGACSPCSEMWYLQHIMSCGPSAVNSPRPWLLSPNRSWGGGYLVWGQELEGKNLPLWPKGN